MSRTSSDANAVVSPTSPSRWAGLTSRLVEYVRSRPHLLWLAAIFVLAFVLRLAWIAYANPNPNDGRFDDTLFYDYAARAVAAGKGYIHIYREPTAQWPPGYPLLLAGIYKVFGHSILAATVLNAFAGAATCLLVYVIAAKMFNRRVGLLAALMLALFPGHIYFSTLLMTESIFPAVLALLLLLVLIWTPERGTLSLPQLLLLGILFGAAALMRGEAGILLLVVLLIWKLAIPSWRSFARYAALLVIGALLAIMPWTIRNAITMNAFIPIASGWGHTFLTGHQSDPYRDSNVAADWELRQEYAYLPYPEREIKVEREAFREGLEFMVAHPGYEFQLLFEKLYHLYEDDSSALDWIRGGWLPGYGEPVVTIPPSAERNWAFLADAYYYAAMLLALVGAPLWFSLRDRKRLLLILFIVGWTAVHLIFAPGPRYHVPLIPILCIWAALPLVAAWERAATHLETKDAV